MHSKFFLFTLTGLLAPVLATEGDCRPLAAGSAPRPTPNTPEAFASFLYYDVVSNKTRHPANYENFMEGRDSSIRKDEAYLTYKELDQYDVTKCAGECDSIKDCASCECIAIHSHLLFSHPASWLLPIYSSLRPQTSKTMN